MSARFVIVDVFLLCLSFGHLFAQVSDIPVECAPTAGTPPPVVCIHCGDCVPVLGGIFLHPSLAPPAVLPSGDSLDSVVITEGSFTDPWRVLVGVASSQVVLDVAGGIGVPTDQQRYTDFFHLPFITGRLLSVAVINRSSVVWNGFEIELQSVLGSPSTPFDGLSFGKLQGPQVGTIELFVPTNLDGTANLNGTPCQGSGWVFPCSDRFQKLSFNHDINSIGDILTFSAGGLPPGHAATFTFLVTDNFITFTPAPTLRTLFFILLRPQLAPIGPG